MWRGPEPDNLRAKGDRAVVFVMREVMNGGSDRHGLAAGWDGSKDPFTICCAAQSPAGQLTPRSRPSRPPELRAPADRPQSRRRQASPACATARALRPRSAASTSRAARRPCAPAIGAELGAFAIDRVAQNRPALRSAMDAQLMRPACLRRKFEPGDRRAAPDSASLDPPERQRFLTLRVDLHPPAALVVEPAERQIDGPLLALGRARDNRPIGLGDLALLEQEPQFL